MKSLVALSILIVAITSGSALADFTYNDFSSTTGLSMVGSTTQYANKVRLTSGVAGQRGTVWTQNQQATGGGFTTSFAFQGTGLGGERDANGNIGIWQDHFILQNTGTNVLQISDYDVATHPRLRIMFDGWKDGDSMDPSSSSVQVVLNGVSAKITDVEAMGIVFRDQAVHQATITYAQQVLKVFVDSKQVVNVAMDLNAAGLSNAFAGFESYCGARAWANNDLLNWSMQSVPEPITLVILGLGGLALRRKF
jgi:hypothetical protein